MLSCIFCILFYFDSFTSTERAACLRACKQKQRNKNWLFVVLFLLYVFYVKLIIINNNIRARHHHDHAWGLENSKRKFIHCWEMVRHGTTGVWCVIEIKFDLNWFVFFFFFFSDTKINTPRFREKSWIAFPALRGAYKHVQVIIWKKGKKQINCSFVPLSLLSCSGDWRMKKKRTRRWNELIGDLLPANFLLLRFESRFSFFSIIFDPLIILARVFPLLPVMMIMIIIILYFLNEIFFFFFCFFPKYVRFN